MKKQTERSRFKKFALLVIEKLIAGGHEYITLRQLYSECGAFTPDAQNGVQWARQKAIDEGKMEKIGVLRGVYKVVR